MLLRSGILSSHACQLQAAHMSHTVNTADWPGQLTLRANSAQRSLNVTQHKVIQDYAICHHKINEDFKRSKLFSCKKTTKVTNKSVQLYLFNTNLQQQSPQGTSYCKIKTLEYKKQASKQTIGKDPFCRVHTFTSRYHDGVNDAETKALLCQLCIFFPKKRRG